MNRLLLVLMLFGAAPLGAQENFRTLTVDASGDGAYIALGDEARVVEVSDPFASAEWDLVFAGTNLSVNGGEGGAGGVTAYCICQNATATDDEVQLMTPETELADFEAVTVADVPAADGEWHPASIAASPWYRYNIAMRHLIWPTYNVYLVKRGGDVYKVQVVGYYGEDGAPRQVTLRYGGVGG